MNWVEIIFLNPSDFIFSIKILTIGAVEPVLPLSIRKTAPVPFNFWDGIPVTLISSLDLIKIGILR